MPTFTEAQVMAWITPLLWPFLRVLALFASAPVLSSRSMPLRVRILLSALVALAAQPSLPAPMPVALDGPAVLTVVLQQIAIGITIGFAARMVLAGIEFGGALIGLKMGLGYATFFDPSSGGTSATSTRLYSTMATLLFVSINGHLLLALAVIESFQAFPVNPDAPLALVHLLQPQVWGAEVFRLGVWVALPVWGMLLLINLVLGVISRVAPQMQIFAVGFPITLSVGLVGIAVTLPSFQGLFTAAFERMLGLLM